MVTFRNQTLGLNEDELSVPRFEPDSDVNPLNALRRRTTDRGIEKPKVSSQSCNSQVQPTEKFSAGNLKISSSRLYELSNQRPLGQWMLKLRLACLGPSKLEAKLHGRMPSILWRLGHRIDGWTCCSAGLVKMTCVTCVSRSMISTLMSTPAAQLGNSVGSETVTAARSEIRSPTR